MQVRDVMTLDVELLTPDDTIVHAAELMAQINSGAAPVGENDRLVGMITDRDITVRATAKGLDPRQTKVRDVMTKNTKYCYEDEDLDEVAHRMGKLQVRRLPVISREKRLVGIVSLGDVALGAGGAKSGDALEGISQPSEEG